MLEAVTHASHFRALSVELSNICNKGRETDLGLELTKSIMTDRLEVTTANAGWNSFRVKPKPADAFRITTVSKFSQDQSSVSYIDPHSSLKTGRRLLRKPKEIGKSDLTMDPPSTQDQWSRSSTHYPAMLGPPRAQTHRSVLMPPEHTSTPFSSLARTSAPIAPFTAKGWRTRLAPRPDESLDADVHFEREASRMLGKTPDNNQTRHKTQLPIKRQLKNFFVSGLWYDIGRLREADPQLRSVPQGLEGRALLNREMAARTRFKPWRVNWNERSHEVSPSKKAILRRFNSPESPRKQRSPSKHPAWNKVSLDKMTRRKRIIKLCMAFLKTKLTLEMDLVQYDDKEIFPRTAYYMPSSKVFFMCVRQGKIEMCNQMLAKAPNLIYQVDDRGRSALHLAVVMRSGVVFDMLLKHKPKLDLEDSQGFRAIDYVLSSNQGYMLRELLTNGAYPFSKVFADRSARTRVYPSNAFMVESAICLWVGGYFWGMGLRRRRKRYLSELVRILKGV